MRRPGETPHRCVGAVCCAVALLAACTDGDAPPTVGTVGAPPSSRSYFADVTQEVALDFDFDRARRGDYFMPDSLAAGCALLDFDGDGDLDAYVVNGFWPGDGSWRHPDGANRLYRQEANRRFVDVTGPSGAGDQGYGMGVAAGDIDNDGDLDLYVSNYGPDVLYRNNGDGTFTDVTSEAGLGDPRWGASAGFVDYDGDGLLDLFVTTYLDFKPEQRAADSAGRPEYPGPTCCRGTSDILYRNRGDGTFSDVSEPSGIASSPGKGLGVAFADLDGDGRPDIYVANDGESNRAWIQNDDGSFTDRGQELGIALNVHGGAEAGMGVVLGDLHGSGRLDLLVTHLSQESNTLYRSGDDGRFSDATLGSGLGSASIDFTGFGSALLDFDLDGDLDPLVVNGRVLRAPLRPGVRLNDHWSPYAEPNLLFENDGAGRFRSASAACGPLCDEIEVSRGLAAGDVDNDGDFDVLVTSGNGRARLYLNVRPHREHWLTVRAVEPERRRDAYGSVIRVRLQDRTIRRDVAPTYSYLSSSDPRVHFGLGSTDRVEEVRVRWPDGVEESFGSLQVDRFHLLERGAGR